MLLNLLQKILKLLNFKNSKKFDIDNVELIRIAVKKGKYSFGIENDFHHNIDDTFIVSWKYGIQKIMFGLCMSNDNGSNYNILYILVECADNISLICYKLLPLFRWLNHWLRILEGVTNL
jgi:exonuclease V gamma subunit